MATARSGQRDGDDVLDPIGRPLEVQQEVGEAIADALIPVLVRLTGCYGSPTHRPALP